jgi:hypothetical protein
MVQLGQGAQPARMPKSAQPGFPYKEGSPAKMWGEILGIVGQM